MFILFFGKNNKKETGTYFAKNTALCILVKALVQVKKFLTTTKENYYSLFKVEAVWRPSDVSY